MGSYFVDINLHVEEATVEVPPLTKDETGQRKKMLYKYQQAKNFLQTWRRHIP